MGRTKKDARTAAFLAAPATASTRGSGGAGGGSSSAPCSPLHLSSGGASDVAAATDALVDRRERGRPNFTDVVAREARDEAITAIVRDLDGDNVDGSDKNAKAPLVVDRQNPKTGGTNDSSGNGNRASGNGGSGGSSGNYASSRGLVPRAASCATHCRVISRGQTLTAVAVSGALVIALYSAAAVVTGGWCGSRRTVWNAALVSAALVDAFVTQPLFVLGVAAARFIMSDSASQTASSSFSSGASKTASCCCNRLLTMMRAAPHPPYPAHGAWIVDEALLPAAMVPVNTTALVRATRSRVVAESARIARFNSLATAAPITPLQTPEGPEDVASPHVPRPMSPGEVVPVHPVRAAPHPYIDSALE